MNRISTISWGPDWPPGRGGRYTALVLGLVALSVTVAVLTSSGLCVVALPAGAPTCAPLPGQGLAVVATPDRRMLVPLRDADATALVDSAGNVQQWRGRFMPLFFDEPDKAYVVLAGEVATVSYPERLPLAHIPLDNLTGATFAAVSPDGRLVVVAPSGQAGPSLVLVAARARQVLEHVALPAAVTQAVVHPLNDSVLVGLKDGKVGVVMPEAGLLPGILELPGSVTALALRADGRVMVAGSGGDRNGNIVCAKVKSDLKNPLREYSRLVTEGPVRGLAFVGHDVVSLVGDRLLLRAGGCGKILQEVQVAGAIAMAVLPEKAGVAVPTWDEE
jgi:hypothetical protein